MKRKLSGTVFIRKDNRFCSQRLAIKTISCREKCFIPSFTQLGTYHYFQFVDIIETVPVLSHCFPGNLGVRILIRFMHSSVRNKVFIALRGRIPIFTVFANYTHWKTLLIGNLFFRCFIQLQTKLSCKLQFIIKT